MNLNQGGNVLGTANTGSTGFNTSSIYTCITFYYLIDQTSNQGSNIYGSLFLFDFCYFIRLWILFQC